MKTLVLPLPEGISDRVETRPVQFGDDSPGVFIRGDQAKFFAEVIDDALRPVADDRLDYDSLTQLKAILEGTRVPLERRSMTDPITSFSGKYRWLSNFDAWMVVAEFNFPKPTSTKKTRIAPTIEHAYQAMKATTLEDFEYVIDSPSPNVAKKRGNEIKCRKDWNEVKLDVMTYCVSQKYMAMGDLSDPELPANKLVATGDAELIEGNWWGDRFWGQSPLGRGENHLGKILMRQRDLLTGKAVF